MRFNEHVVCVCDAEHEYKERKVPAPRRKTAPPALFTQVLDSIDAAHRRAPHQLRRRSGTPADAAPRSRGSAAAESPPTARSPTGTAVAPLAEDPDAPTRPRARRSAVPAIADPRARCRGPKASRRRPARFPSSRCTQPTQQRGGTRRAVAADAPPPAGGGSGSDFAARCGSGATRQWPGTRQRRPAGPGSGRRVAAGAAARRTADGDGRARARSG